MSRTAAALLCVLLLSVVDDTKAQEFQRAEGLPFLRCYDPEVFGGHAQNWSFAQDRDGLIYIGNGRGIVIHDGSNWQTIPTETRSTVRAVEIDSTGTVFAGSVSDFGYLKPDHYGVPRYHSMVPHIPVDQRDFNDIWTINATEEGVYFMARERLFRARLSLPDSAWTFDTWTPETRFLYSFWVNGRLFLHEGRQGLLQMVGDSLQLVPGGARFAGERLQIMLPMDDEAGAGVLVGAFNAGLFTFDGNGFERFAPGLTARFRDATLYKGVVLADGSYGLATLEQGFLVVDGSGNLVQVIDREAGLSDNTVIAAFVDRAGGLWLAPEGQICRTRVPSPYARYDASLGVVGSVYRLQRHAGRLYAGTANGIIVLNEATGRFEEVPGLAPGNKQVLAIESAGDALLAAAGTGLYEVVAGNARVIQPNVGGSFPNVGLNQSRFHEDRVYVGLLDGVVVMKRLSGGDWRNDGHIPGVTEEVRGFVETGPDEVWMSTQSVGVLRVRFPEGDIQNAVVERFGSEDGLEDEGALAVAYEGDVLFPSTEGTFSFDESTGRFFRDTRFDVVDYDGITSNGFLAQDSGGNAWLSYDREAVHLRPTSDGSFEVDRIPVLELADRPAVHILPDPEEQGVVWFGTTRSVIRYDPAVPDGSESVFPALIRAVTIDGDSLIYGGSGIPSPVNEIPHALNALRIEFAAPSYDKPDATSYSSKLEGFDKRWSEWGFDRRRDYTNLPPGRFQFQVRARDVRGRESKTSVFSFRVLPPWYRMWWAWLLYAILLALGIFGVDRVQRRRLLRKERERSRLREAELRATVAEASAKTLQVENERIKNVELLSEIGRDITASLAIDDVIDTVYENVNALMDASIFGVGILNEAENRVEFPATKEKGETLPPYVSPLSDENRLAVWCVKNRKEIVIGDFPEEYARYIDTAQAPLAGDDPVSILYLPLLYKGEVTGVITTQSFERNAYTDYHVNILRNLAAYAAVAIDNAEAYRRLNTTLEHLKTTQEQLVTQEKLASLGALAAGIAHEIKNPLNFVNNFAELSVELADELSSELEERQDERVGEVLEELNEILDSLRINALKINENGRRADGIVRSMMQHASGGEGQMQVVEVNGFVEEYVNLAYHGMRAQYSDFSVDIVRDYKEESLDVRLLPQEIGRVLINLLSNAFQAVHELGPEDETYQPQVRVTTDRADGNVVISISDNGPGVPEQIQERIFEPFFTTKPTGSGTGLGLSMSYDIVANAHGGSLTLDSEPGRGATFSIALPA